MIKIRAVTTGYAKVRGALGPPCFDVTEGPPYFTYLPIGKWCFMKLNYSYVLMCILIINF